MYFIESDEDPDNYYIYVNADSWLSVMGTNITEAVVFLDTQFAGS